MPDHYFQKILIWGGVALNIDIYYIYQVNLKRWGWEPLHYMWFWVYSFSKKEVIKINEICSKVFLKETLGTDHRVEDRVKTMCVLFQWCFIFLSFYSVCVTQLSSPSLKSSTHLVCNIPLSKLCSSAFHVGKIVDL